MPKNPLQNRRPGSSKASKRVRRQEKQMDPRSTGKSDDGMTLEQIAAAQGVKPAQELDQLLGAGASLWRSEEEFKEFLNGIYQRRRANRENSESQ